MKPVPPELFLPVIEEIYGNYNLDQDYRVCSQVWSPVNTLFLPQTLEKVILVPLH